jgi:hypothetical protein
MKPLPLPLRVAAGLAATAVDCARDLPTRLAGLPVTVASQAMQLSMRVQQQVTELAIKGDEIISALRQPVDETPEWATFDEDTDAVVDQHTYQAHPFATEPGNGQRTASTAFPMADDEIKETGEDPWAMEETAIAEEAVDRADPSPHAPAGMANYDDLSLPQLRAKLRALSLAQLEELLDYERGNAARPSFVGMLTRRIGTVQAQQAQSGTTGRARGRK